MNRYVKGLAFSCPIIYTVLTAIIATVINFYRPPIGYPTFSSIMVSFYHNALSIHLGILWLVLMLLTILIAVLASIYAMFAQKYKVFRITDACIAGLFISLLFIISI